METGAGSNQVFGGDLPEGRFAFLQEPKDLLLPAFSGPVELSRLPFLISSRMSRSMILPPGPVPVIASSITRFSPASFLALGEIAGFPFPGFTS